MNINLYANRILRPIAEKKKEDIFDSIAITGMRASPGPGNISQPEPPIPPVENPYEAIVGVNTTADGRQVKAVVGDSIARGSNNSNGPGPTPTSGTVFQYNGSAIIEIGSSDVYNEPSGGGTAWPKFGIDYNSYTGYKPVIIPRGSSGANISGEAGDLDNNWSATGLLRADAETQTADCLAALGLTKLMSIMVVCGVNDARGVEDLTTVVGPGIDDFFDWLEETWPGVPILVAQVGREEDIGHNDRLYFVRNRIRENVINRTNVHFAFSMCRWVSDGGYGAGDQLHPVQAGNNDMGACFARWWHPDNVGYPKWGRSIISSLSVNITGAHKTLIQNFVNTLGSSLFKMEYVGLFKTEANKDIFLDWSFRGYLFNSAGTWVQNAHIATNGSNQHYVFTFIPSINNSSAALDDFVVCVKVKDNATAQGTISFVFGALSTGTSMSVQQTNTPSIAWRSNDNTVSSYTGQLSVQDDTAYATARNGGTKSLIINDTVVQSASVAATSALALLPLIGAFNNNGTTQNRMNGQFEYGFASKFSDIDFAEVRGAFETLVDNW